MIVLVMIVKDEAPVIRRCLESVKPFIDGYVIADTGSTDGTVPIISEVMDYSKRGQIAYHPWVNFEHNRNKVLDLAREWVEGMEGAPHYALTIDADEVLSGGDPVGGILHPMLIGHPRDGWNLPVKYAGTEYLRTALIRLDRPWRWVGAVHEYLALEGASIGLLSAPWIEVHHDGARSRDPETYRKDAELLAAELEKNPDDPRTQFYYAQSLRDSGKVRSARIAYAKRANNEAGYQAERWHSLWQIARLSEIDRGTVATAAYLKAYNFDPTRAEPLVDLATRERGRGRFPLALMYSREACTIMKPSDGLFVDVASYTWRVWDEHAIAAFYCGHYAEAAAAARKALSFAPNDRRLIDNLEHCERMLR